MLTAPRRFPVWLMAFLAFDACLFLALVLFLPPWLARRAREHNEREAIRSLRALVAGEGAYRSGAPAAAPVDPGTTRESAPPAPAPPPAPDEAKITSNDGAAPALLRRIAFAQEQWSSGNAYGRNRATLAQLSGTTLPYIDEDLARGRKAGYSFVLTLHDFTDPWLPPRMARRYVVLARPIEPGRTGRRFFYMEQSEEDMLAVVRFRLGAPASSADSPIE